MKTTVKGSHNMQANDDINDASKNKLSEQNDSLQNDIIELQATVSHLEATIDSLDAVVAKQDKQLQDIQRQLQLMFSYIANRSEADSAVFDVASEVPPHY